jgi:hypothetical protein
MRNVPPIGGLVMGWLNIVIIASSVLAVACSDIRYIQYDSSDPGHASSDRVVKVEISDEFLRSYPDCVAVMPVVGNHRDTYGAMLVEQSLVRHLYQKITRVIGPIERDYIARRLGADLSIPTDVEDVLEAGNCDAYLVAEVLQPEMTSVLVWSQIRLGVDAKLMQTKDGKILWQAQHMGQRSAGGVPFSVLGVVTETYESTTFSSDKEVMYSIIDDVVRRIVAAIPNGVMLSSRASLNPSVETLHREPLYKALEQNQESVYTDSCM